LYFIVSSPWLAFRFVPSPRPYFTKLFRMHNRLSAIIPQNLEVF
jgi:hypothetical protein